MEFPHLLQLIEQCQFDTICHEHFHYLSLGTVKRIFKAHGLEIYDVEELPTHGGPLRIYAAHREYGQIHMQDSVGALLMRERDFGLEDIRSYANFSKKIQKIKLDTLRQLSEWKRNGKRIATDYLINKQWDGLQTRPVPLRSDAGIADAFEQNKAQFLVKILMKRAIAYPKRSVICQKLFYRKASRPAWACNRRSLKFILYHLPAGYSSCQPFPLRFLS